MTSINLAGKVAIIIGGTSGIGRTLSLGFADAGANVIASSRHKENVEEVASEVERRGLQTLRLTSDLRDRKTLEQLAATSQGRFGKIDILVNCAAKIRRTPTINMTEEEWQDIIDTNWNL